MIDHRLCSAFLALLMISGGHCQWSIGKPCKTPEGQRGRCKTVCQAPVTIDSTNPCRIGYWKYGVCCPINSPITTDGSKVTTGFDITIPPKSKVCGWSPGMVGRVISGMTARANDWPWMVTLLLKTHGDLLLCGGSLISDQHILTAAHCTILQTDPNMEPVPIKADDYAVRIGRHNYKRSSPDETMDGPKVARIFRHAGYNRTTHENDIALLKLSRKIRVNPQMSPICLPDSDLIQPGIDGVVAGWGRTNGSDPRSTSDTLRQVTLPIWDQSQCVQLYGLFNISVLPDMFCASPVQDNRYTAAGDSGGPFMLLNDKGLWMAAGVVSWGVPIQPIPNVKFPAVFGRVLTHRHWIKKMMNL